MDIYLRIKEKRKNQGNGEQGRLLYDSNIKEDGCSRSIKYIQRQRCR